MDFKTVKVSDKNGNVVQNADVSVYVANTKSSVPVFDENGAELTPAQMKTNSNGQIGFAAQNGVYDVEASLSGVSTAVVQNVRFFDPSDLESDVSDTMLRVSSLELTTLPFDTVQQLLASTASTFGGAGAIIEAGGFRYEEAASDATDHHLTTAGGAKLYVLPGAEGYDAVAFGVIADGATDMSAILAQAVASLPDGAKLNFPQGTIAITETLDLRDKGRCVFDAPSGIARFVQHGVNIPIIKYGATVPGLPQRGGLGNVQGVFAVKPEAAHTNAIGLEFSYTGGAMFGYLEFTEVHSGIKQASTLADGMPNVVFECKFPQVYIYGFQGYGIYLEPKNTGGTPNQWGKVYINGDGNDVLAGVDLRGQPDHFDALNLENMTATERGLFSSSGSGNAVNIEYLYMEKADISSAARGMIYNGVNSLNINVITINSTEFDGNIRAATPIFSFFDGAINVGLLTFKGITKINAGTVRLFSAFNSSTNPAKIISVQSTLLLSDVDDFGDTQDIFVDRLLYPWSEKQTIVYAGFVNPDFRRGWLAEITLAGNITIDNPILNSRRRGSVATIIIIQDGTGGRMVSWGGDFDVSSSVSIGAGDVTIIRVMWDGGKWREV